MLMCYDKKRAINGEFRISESVFFILSLLGGALGTMFGMRYCRHKTKKPAFKILVPVFLLLNLSVLFLIYFYT
ncbi:MAG TPA: DUF1294 domain-containing protein [Clostridia bacterium]|nr:DUF1294 domain-containing protein [Clostridia bacterium]HXK73179.1 DUF1294 domain-containing protein [Clostridia bacterium]